MQIEAVRKLFLKIQFNEASNDVDDYGSQPPDHAARKYGARASKAKARARLLQASADQQVQPTLPSFAHRVGTSVSSYS